MVEQLAVDRYGRSVERSDDTYVVRGPDGAIALSLRASSEESARRIIDSMSPPGWESPTRTEPAFLVSAPLVPGTLQVSGADWEVLGTVVTSVDFFCPDLVRAFGELLGAAIADGDGAELRLTEDKDGAVTVMSGVVSIPPGGWSVIRFPSLGTPRVGPCAYRLEGRLGTATSAFVRGCSLTLFRIDRVPV